LIGELRQKPILLGALLVPEDKFAIVLVRRYRMFDLPHWGLWLCVAARRIACRSKAAAVWSRV